MSPPTLWQFKYSHYNEKVRWALDFKRLGHRRRSLLPGAHAPVLLLHTRQKQVPVLELDDEIVCDSTAIIERLERLQPEPALYPADRGERKHAVELEEYFDQQLGPALRLLWFHRLLEDPTFVAEQLSVGFGAIEQSVFRAAFPVIRRVMAFDMGINASSAQSAEAQVLETLDRLEKAIRPSSYLVGDTFSIADLTAAALWSPLVMPPQFPYPLLTPLPKSAEDWRATVIDRPGMRWVREMYRRHRGVSAEVAA